MVQIRVGLDQGEVWLCEKWVGPGEAEAADWGAC